MGTVRDGVYYSKHKGDAIDNLLDKTVWQSNLNLLDNWYFVGGGSQQGGGQFPINQRGQTSYSGTGFKIDRWNVVLAPSDGALTINSDSITLSGATTTNGYVLYQQVESVSSLIRGKKLTYSVLYVVNGAVTLASKTFTAANSGYIESNNYMSDAKWNIGVTQASATSKDIIFRVFSGGASDSPVPFTIIAVKLELGDTQTLAHQDENGNWVLNEIPNYQEQLARCQRYQFVLGSNDSTGDGAIAGNAFAATENIFAILVPLPVTMLKKTPSLIPLSGTGVYGIVSIGSDNYFPYTFSVDRMSTNILRINATGNVSGLTPGTAGMWILSDRKVLIDANL